MDAVGVGIGKPVFQVSECVEEKDDVGESEPNAKVDAGILFEKSADDGNAANFEYEACQECRRKLGHQLQLSKKASSFQH